MQETELLALILKEMLEEFSSTIGRRAAYGIASRAAAKVLREEGTTARLDGLLPQAFLAEIRRSLDATNEARA